MLNARHHAAVSLGLHAALVPRLLCLFAQLYQRRALLARLASQPQKDLIVQVYAQMARFAVPDLSRPPPRV